MSSRNSTRTSSNTEADPKLIDFFVFLLNTLCDDPHIVVTNTVFSQILLKGTGVFDTLDQAWAPGAHSFCDGIASNVDIGIQESALYTKQWIILANTGEMVGRSGGGMFHFIVIHAVSRHDGHQRRKLSFTCYDSMGNRRYELVMNQLFEGMKHMIEVAHKGNMTVLKGDIDHYYRPHLHPQHGNAACGYYSMINAASLALLKQGPAPGFLESEGWHKDVFNAMKKISKEDKDAFTAICANRIGGTNFWAYLEAQDIDGDSLTVVENVLRWLDVWTVNLTITE